jgi:hypothetical protein
MCKRSQSDVSLVLDTKKPSGVLSNTVNQSGFRILQNLLEGLAQKHGFNLILAEYQKQQIRSENRLQFNYPFNVTHCFRGYPIYGSFKQFLDTEEKYILHLDCDMIFYEEPSFSWVREGIKIMEENEDVLCVLPRGGPPTKDKSLNQGTTPYQTDEKRGLYLFKNFTSRHYLIHRERFLSLLPLKPLWLSLREPIKSRLFGNGKMLCWEAMVEHALQKSDMWRADLMTEKAWSLHPAERSEEFYHLLPKIIKSVSQRDFPEEQRGNFDLNLNDWKHFLKPNLESEIDKTNL